MYSKEQTALGLLVEGNPTKLEGLADILKFSKAKCKVLYLG